MRNTNTTDEGFLLFSVPKDNLQSWNYITAKIQFMERRNEMITVSWFSAGVSSAVATKLIIDEVDRIIYTHIDDQPHLLSAL